MWLVTAMSAGCSQTVSDDTLWRITGSRISLLHFMFSLRNDSGQTAADLARAHGFLSCCHLITDNLNREQNGNSSCGQALLSRKRLLTAVDTVHTKKAKRAESKSLWNPSTYCVCRFFNAAAFISVTCLLLQMCWCTVVEMSRWRAWMWSQLRASAQVRLKRVCD